MNLSSSKSRSCGGRTGHKMCRVPEPQMGKRRSGKTGPFPNACLFTFTFTLSWWRSSQSCSSAAVWIFSVFSFERLKNDQNSKEKVPREG